MTEGYTQERDEELVKELDLDDELVQDEAYDTCIAYMTTDEVETLWADPIKRSGVLAQLLGGLLASLHPLREGEITVTDADIRKGLTKHITIDRYDAEGESEGFFHVKLKD